MCTNTIALKDILGLENTENLVSMLDRIRGRAIERHAEQEVTVQFNKTGEVRVIKGSDNVNGAKPKMFAPE